MASTYSTSLRLEKQGVGENRNTWGTILNTQIEMLEDAIAGRVSVVLAAANVTLSTEDGTADQARNMILDCTGSLSANVNVVIPNQPKMYVVRNGTTEDFTVGIKTASGSAVTIPQGETNIVFCDGSDNVYKLSALSSGTVALATNALQLGGVVAASYAKLATFQEFTAGQAVKAVSLGAGGSVTPDPEATNVWFTAQLTSDLTINNPSNTPKDGQPVTFIIQQSAGTLRTVTWGTKFLFPDDTDATLTATVDKVDVFTGIYIAGLDRYLMGGQAKNFSRS